MPIVNGLVAVANTVALPPSVTEDPLMVRLELASIPLVTVPVSAVLIRVPVRGGSVRTPAAEELAFKLVVPVVPEKSIPAESIQATPPSTRPVLVMTQSVDAPVRDLQVNCTT